jgi:hypothetical protein
MSQRDEFLTALTVAMKRVRPERGALRAVGQMPSFVPAELQPFAIAVTTLAADGLRARLSGEPGLAPELARTLNMLSAQLDKAGQRDEAVRASGEALALRRRLAAADPPPMSLNWPSRWSIMRSGWLRPDSRTRRCKCHWRRWSCAGSW